MLMHNIRGPYMIALIQRLATRNYKEVNLRQKELARSWGGSGSLQA